MVRPSRWRVLLLVALAFASIVASPVPAGSSPPPTRVDRLVMSPPTDSLAMARRLTPLARTGFPLDPLPRCAVLDNFGDPRSRGRRHQGTDILASLGQSVFAMVDGVLAVQVVAGRPGSELSGNSWRLVDDRDGATYYSYMHLSRFAEGLSAGSWVAKGQLIGFVGDTGNPGAGNYHLHFEIHPGGGAAVDPMSYLTIPPECRVW